MYRRSDEGVAPYGKCTGGVLCAVGYYRLGNKDYNAKVIVGFTSSSNMVLYDVVDFTPTKFKIKEGKSIGYANNAGSLRNDLSSNITVPQSGTGVNSNSMQKIEKGHRKNPLRNGSGFNV